MKHVLSNVKEEYFRAGTLSTRDNYCSLKRIVCSLIYIIRVHTVYCSALSGTGLIHSTLHFLCEFAKVSTTFLLNKEVPRYIYSYSMYCSIENLGILNRKPCIVYNMYSMWLCKRCSLSAEQK